MDSDEENAALRAAFDTMQEQIQFAHWQWIVRLAEAYPHLADAFWEYHNHYCVWHRYAEALPLVLTLNPKLSLPELARRYGADIEASTTEGTQDADESEVEIARLNRVQRAGRTKRLRSREALIEAAIRIIKEGGRFMTDEIAAAAGVSRPTVDSHFASKSQLLRIAYERLFPQLLGPNDDE